MMIGKRLNGRYKILDMIGGGGMANVYLAHDMILDRDVAVKMLRLDFANDEEFIRRFRREAQSATSLAHPNIVSIFDVGEEDTIYYIVMEYVDGHTLKQYIQQYSPLPIEEALDILKQLTSALSHAHQNHIIHRDIKPHNILIDKNGNVKITDFGIAMALSATSITQTNSVLGSVHYLSPEQARGGMANNKSDIYSLGIVMFELLTGRLPFSGESAVSIALKHLQSETPSARRWNPAIPQSVENIILKATAKDQTHRYNSADEMEDDLRTALEPERMDEPKFIIPIDDDATKAIPIITNDRTFESLDETIVHRENTKDLNKNQNEFSKNGEIKDKDKKKKKWSIVLVSVFFALILLGGLAFTALPKMLAPKNVEIPDVSGLEVDQAKTELKAAGFLIGDTIPINDEKVEEGHVIKTDPKAEKTVKEGTEISIYESIGKKKFKLSDYTGRQYEDVVELLEKSDFKSINKIEVFHENEPPGTILSQNFSSGDEIVPDETTLEFTISKGPELIRLKDLSGFNEKGVEEYGETSGLLITWKKEYHDTIPEGLVISQSPQPDTTLKKGATVTVIISNGKEEIPPKTVVEDITIPYEPTEEGVQQEVQIYIEDMNRSMTEAYETLYIKETVKKRIELTIPHGKKAGYKVIRDKSVIIDQVVPYPE